MSDDEQRLAANIEAADEVEAHKRTAASANEEAGDENDVEAHKRTTASANEEAGDENDVEAHMRHTSAEDHRRAARPI
jgi:hypothetical protein